MPFFVCPVLYVISQGCRAKQGYSLKYSLDFQKIERLKGSLHMLDAQDKPKNKHIVFVDKKKDGEYISVASLV